MGVTLSVHWVSGIWSGDVNLHEHVLERLLKEYIERVEFVKEIGLGDRTNS